MCPPVEEAPANGTNGHANDANGSNGYTNGNSHEGFTSILSSPSHIRTTGPHTSLWATFYPMFLGSKLSNQHREKESNLQAGLEGTALFMSKANLERMT
jgi:hypothetical protein